MVRAKVLARVFFYFFFLPWLCITLNPYICHGVSSFHTHFCTDVEITHSCYDLEFSQMRTGLPECLVPHGEWVGKPPGQAAKRGSVTVGGGGLNHPVSCEYMALLAHTCTHTHRTHSQKHTNRHKKIQIIAKTPIKARNKIWVSHCFVVYCDFFFFQEVYL